jgi:uncharacterized membrane protein YgdD (TMEM256/DUF423 family)
MSTFTVRSVGVQVGHGEVQPAASDLKPDKLNLKQDMSTRLLVHGFFAAMVAVTLGAFGAHGLKELVSEQALTTWETGVRYHMYHAFALIVAGLAAPHLGASSAILAGRFFSVGILLFSGSLYALALTGMSALGAITPLGGLAFIAGWWVLFRSARISCNT